MTQDRFSKGYQRSRAARIETSQAAPRLRPGVETNLRIVLPGAGLELPVRRARLKGSGLGPDVIEKACAALRYEHGLAAVKPRHKDGNPCLLVATREPIPRLRVAGENWEAKVLDEGEEGVLSLGNPLESDRVAQLIERALLDTVRSRTARWTLESPRNWYEEEPFLMRDGIAAYRRVSVSALSIEGVGVGIAADVQTGFFTEAPLAWFFDPKVPEAERRRRLDLFNRLTARQDGQQGTLMYDSGRRGRSTCYFQSPSKATCKTTGEMRVKNKTYDSLWHYYRERHPEMEVAPGAPVVYVGFKGIDKAQPIAADRAWVRVMNDNVPESVRDSAAMTPDERRRALEEFWDTLGTEPLGELAPGLQEGFWRPEGRRVWRVPVPELEFGGGAVLPPPCNEAPSARPRALSGHFRARKEMLEREGCFNLPSTVGRKLVCPHPKEAAEAARQLADDVAARLKAWTKKTFDIVAQPYQVLEEGIEKAKSLPDADFALFVLNRHPAAYHKVEWELGQGKMHVKRVTDARLIRCFRDLTEGKKFRGQLDLEKGRQSWESFVTMTTLDVLCQMGGVPFRTRSLGSYDAQLVIDVSHDRRYFGVALLVAREDKVQPFGIFADVQAKIDPKCEAINAKVLEDAIVQLVKGWLIRQAGALSSLLVVRDGKLCGDEPKAVGLAVGRLEALGRIAPDARVDIVELHKDTLKVLRAWEVLPSGEVANVEECTAIEISPGLCVLATTGRATLHQGTSDLVVVSSRGGCPLLREATDSIGAAAQLNWASPGVAQRLPLPVKRLDEDLVSHAAQDIKHLR